MMMMISRWDHLISSSFLFWKLLLKFHKIRSIQGKKDSDDVHFLNKIWSIKNQRKNSQVQGVGSYISACACGFHEKLFYTIRWRKKFFKASKPQFFMIQVNFFRTWKFIFFSFWSSCSKNFFFEKIKKISWTKCKKFRKSTVKTKVFIQFSHFCIGNTWFTRIVVLSSTLESNLLSFFIGFPKKYFS